VPQWGLATLRVASLCTVGRCSALAIKGDPDGRPCLARQSENFERYSLEIHPPSLPAYSLGYIKSSYVQYASDNYFHITAPRLFRAFVVLRPHGCVWDQIFRSLGSSSPA